MSHSVTVNTATTRQTILAIGKSGKIPIEHPEAYGLCFPPTKESEKLRKVQVCIKTVVFVDLAGKERNEGRFVS